MREVDVAVQEADVLLGPEVDILAQGAPGVPVEVPCKVQTCKRTSDSFRKTPLSTDANTIALLKPTEMTCVLFH